MIKAKIANELDNLPEWTGRYDADTNQVAKDIADHLVSAKIEEGTISGGGFELSGQTWVRYKFQNIIVPKWPVASSIFRELVGNYIAEDIPGYEIIAQFKSQVRGNNRGLFHIVHADNPYFSFEPEDLTRKVKLARTALDVAEARLASLKESCE